MAKCSTAHQHDYKRILQAFAQLGHVNGTVPKGRPTHCNYYAGRERDVQQWVKHSKMSNLLQLLNHEDSSTRLLQNIDNYGYLSICMM